MGDFNVPVNEAESPFVHFMETLYSCSQYIRQPTTDSGSVLYLVFANCDAFCDVIEAYWTDHKLFLLCLRHIDCSKYEQKHIGCINCTYPYEKNILFQCLTKVYCQCISSVLSFYAMI